MHQLSVWVCSLLCSQGIYAGRTLLHCAAAKGFTSLVRSLLARGADASATDKRGCTAAELAIKGGHSELAQALDAGHSELALKAGHSEQALEVGHSELAQALATPAEDGQRTKRARDEEAEAEETEAEEAVESERDTVGGSKGDADGGTDADDAGGAT